MSGIFETMRAIDGRVPLLGRHLTRLGASAAALGLTCPGEDAIVEQIVAALDTSAALRVRLDLDGGGIISVQTSPAPAPRSVRLALVPSFDPGDAPRHKTRDRADYAAAARAARTAGADHPLLVSSEGLVGETDHANIFAVIDGNLITPPTGGILPGVARSVLIDDFGAIERPLTAGELASASEVFLTNALRGVIPIACLGQATMVHGPIACAAHARVVER